jgi:ATP-binding cassette subfamily B protein
MVPGPLPSDEKPPASTDEATVPESEKEPLASAAVRIIPDKAAAPPPSGDDDEEEGIEALALEDDEEDEDLVVFTAKEAAGALATMWGFVKPYLANYKKILTFVALGVVIETLFNVIMPLSLKFLIDDALGEEDFEALVKILSVLGAAGIFTSIVAVWYERWDARLAAALISDVRTRLFDHVQNPAGGLFRAHPARRDPVALLGRSLGVRRRGEKFCQ